MKRYTAIFLDLDNTILDFNRSEQTAIRQVLALHGLPHDEDTARIYSKINQRYWEAHERGEIPREAIFVGRFRTLVETLNFKIDPEKLSDDYFGALAAGHDVIDGARPFLAWLRENDFAVYATTNGIARTQYRRLRDAELNNCFDGVFVSESVGAQKPSVQYFETVLSQIPYEKDEILIIGDSPSSDLQGGINVGIDTCWYNPKGLPQTVKPTYTVTDFDGMRKIFKKTIGNE